MTFLATRRRFGRYVYAFGGNPDAAELAGINTRRTIMVTFVAHGHARAPSRRRSRPPASTPRRSTSAPEHELYVIAAAVIGGTSFAGGIGTIPGAVLGAVVMQSLPRAWASSSRLAVQDIVVGIVLVAAVGLDTLRTAEAAA